MKDWRLPHGSIPFSSTITIHKPSPKPSLSTADQKQPASSCKQSSSMRYTVTVGCLLAMLVSWVGATILAENDQTPAVGMSYSTIEIPHECQQSFQIFVKRQNSQLQSLTKCDIIYITYFAVAPRSPVLTSSFLTAGRGRPFTTKETPTTMPSMAPSSISTESSSLAPTASFTEAGTAEDTAITSYEDYYSPPVHGGVMYMVPTTSPTTAPSIEQR